MVQVVEHWHRLPREVMESPSLEMLKTQLDTALNNLLYLTLLSARGWTGQSLEVPANLNYSVIL